VRQCGVLSGNLHAANSEVLPTAGFSFSRESHRAHHPQRICNQAERYLARLSTETTGCLAESPRRLGGAVAAKQRPRQAKTLPFAMGSSRCFSRLRRASPDARWDFNRAGGSGASHFFQRSTQTVPFASLAKHQCSSLGETFLKRSRQRRGRSLVRRYRSTPEHLRTSEGPPKKLRSQMNLSRGRVVAAELHPVDSKTFALLATPLPSPRPCH
jgi:hypothetical protein